jgi:hypothetical protein
MPELRPDRMVPREVRDELLRLYRTTPRWLHVDKQDQERYHAVPMVRSWLLEESPNTATLMGTYAIGQWIARGPKVFKLTAGQQEALAQIDLTMPSSDFSSPFPAVLVQTDVPPYYATLVYWDEEEAGIICNAFSHDEKSDICTTIYREAPRIEDTILKYDEDCQDCTVQCHKALRIALNGCLALSHFGHHRDYLFPAERQQDRWASVNAKRPEARRAAADRLATAPELLTFSQDVKLHATERIRSTVSDGEPTGREVRAHWRRGHWRKQACGEGFSQHKRILIRPVMVRADRFAGNASDTFATYRT